jgi:predicted O-methyltransferase YrrM
MIKTHAHELAESFGYLHDGEVSALMLLAEITHWHEPLIVNVGVGAGTSSLAFAIARPDAKIISVDKSEGGPLGGFENEKNAFEKYGYPLPGQLLGDSKEIGKEWGKVDLGLVFIDGDHSPEGVRGDIEAWMQFIIPTGIIAFHDYGSRKWPAVRAEVDKVFSEGSHILHVNTIKAFRV